MSKAALVAIALVMATPVFANPADAANPDESVSRQFATYCPPGLEYAAGACVRSCPGGYEDTGKICVFRNEGH